MKKTIVLFCIIILLSGCSKTEKITIDGDLIDNSYNNYLAGGRVCRINNDLYFYYLNNGTNYGLYEINSKTSRKIFWEGSKSLYSALPNYPLYVNEDKIYSTNYIFDFTTNNFKDLGKNIEGFIDGKMLFSQKSKKIKKHGDRNLEELFNIFPKYDLYYDNEIIIKDFELCYITKDKIFYTSINEFGICVIYEYQVSSMKSSEVFSIDCSENYNKMITQIICFENFIVYQQRERQGLRAYDIKNKIDKSIFNENLNSFNIYDGKVFINSFDGLKSFDLITNDSAILCDKYTEQCYVVDNKWIYFVGEKSVLWRVTNDGKVLEKIYD